MKASYSRILTHIQCPYKYKLKYIDKLEVYPDKSNATNALYLGTALHEGIELDCETAIQNYFDNYNVLTDDHYIEAEKLKYRIQQCNDVLPKGIYETKIEAENEFIGYIDMLVKVDENLYDMYDFKYSNNVNNYLNSSQLHLYKYYFEKLNPPKKIRNLYYVIAPKVNIRRKRKNKTNRKDESLQEFKQRVDKELKKSSINILQITYDCDKVRLFKENVKDCETDETFEKCPSRLCSWCDYEGYCVRGDDTMILPKNERGKQTINQKKKMWFYGRPFSGKTYLVNQFPNLLLLSTDGNYNNLPNGIPPHIDLTDKTVYNGRIATTKFAWETFKEVVEELSKKENDFDTICVDLLDDLFESCRHYMYKKLNITHESDDSFKAWDIIRGEFLSVMKQFMALDYPNIVLISHEDTTRDITKRSGDKLTSVLPNIQAKVADKLSGMVDIIGRIINSDGERVISFKSDEVVFGGGRLNLKELEIPCEYDTLIDLYSQESETKEEPKEETAKEEINNRRR